MEKNKSKTYFKSGGSMNKKKSDSFVSEKSSSHEESDTFVSWIMDGIINLHLSFYTEFISLNIL